MRYVRLGDPAVVGAANGAAWCCKSATLLLQMSVKLKSEAYFTCLFHKVLGILPEQEGFMFRRTTYMLFFFNVCMVNRKKMCYNIW